MGLARWGHWPLLDTAILRVVIHDDSDDTVANLDEQRNHREVLDREDSACAAQ